MKLGLYAVLTDAAPPVSALARFRGAGVGRAILAKPPGDEDETLRRLGGYAELDRGDAP